MSTEVLNNNFKFEFKYPNGREDLYGSCCRTAISAISLPGDGVPVFQRTLVNHRVIGFVHDWANREATQRSWDLVARYVLPEVSLGSSPFFTGWKKDVEAWLHRNRSVNFGG